MPSVLGLSTYRWNNNLKSIGLLAMFPFLLLGLLGAIFYGFGFFYASQPGANGMLDAQFFENFNITPQSASYTPQDLALGAIYQYWPIVTGIAIIWLLIGYFFNDAMIHSATGAQAITRQDAPKLYGILENLCISRGMKTPNLYIIDSDEMNAYASGIDQSSFAITVTKGILEKLNDQEMEAVLAHELTHIINRDCRLLIITIVFVGMISFIAQILWRGMQVASYSRDRRGGMALPLMLIAGVILSIGYVFALILRFAISRKREFLADAGSVELTKDPEALISALKKIATAPDVAHVPSEVKQMFIENPPSFSDFFGLFATHPPIEERIEILEKLGGLPPAGHSIIPPTSS